MTTATVQRAGTTPRSGRWHLDPARASVAFSGRTSRLSPTVQARFQGVTGSVDAGPEPEECVVDVAVDVTSMTSGNRAWDELVATLDPFSAASFPTARYRSTSVRWNGRRAAIDGVLELRGAFQPLRLEAQHEVFGGGDRLRISASGAVDRVALGIRCDIPGAALLLPRRLSVTIDVVAVHEDAW